MDHGDIDPCLAAHGVVLVVLRQPAIPPQPAERPLHDPSPLHRLELLLTRPLARRLPPPPAMTLDPCRHGLGPECMVGEPLGKSGHPAPDPLEYLRSPNPGGLPG